MSNLAKQITTAILLIFSGVLLAQQNVTPAFSATEKIRLHTNATTLVSGETLYYKLYCHDAGNRPGQLSKIAYVSLVGPDRKAVFTQKLYLENGVAQGDFFIPSSLNSGSYKLVGYTKWMAGQPVTEIPQLDVAVINPFAPAGKMGSEMSYKSMRLSSLNASVTAKKPTWAAREKIELDITLPSDGNYSLSVRRKDSLSTLFPEQSTESQSTFKLSESRFMPELRGETISGKLTTKNGAAVSGITVSLSFPGKSFATKVINTRNDGSFTFTLDHPYFQSEAVLQVGSENRENFTVTLDDLPQPDFSSLTFAPFPVTEAARSNIKAHAVASQIENAYFVRKKDSIAAFATIPNFYEPSGTVYKLDDYTRFATFAETLTEVVEGTYFTKKDNKYSVHVREFIVAYDPTGDSMVLVDGIWLPDPSELFDYPAKNIDRITSIPGTYYLGSKGFNGLVSVQTKEGKYQPKSEGSYILKDKLPRPFPPKNYYAPDYSANNDTRIPDYRYQLAWIPKLENQKTVAFYASDVKGTFEAVIEGFAQDGTPVFATAAFEVR